MKKQKLLQIRVEPEKHEKIIEIAKRMGLTKSSFCRMVILKEIRGDNQN